MATIDKLLLALAAKKMDCLVLEPGRRPCLRKGGTDHEVTKTPLDGPVIDRLLREIAPPGEVPEAQEQDRWEFDYAVGQRVFRFFGLNTPNGWLVSVTHDPTAKVPEPPPETMQPPMPEPALFEPPAAGDSLESAPPPQNLWPKGGGGSSAAADSVLTAEAGPSLAEPVQTELPKIEPPQLEPPKVEPTAPTAGAPSPPEVPKIQPTVSPPVLPATETGSPRPSSPEPPATPTEAAQAPPRPVLVTEPPPPVPDPRDETVPPTDPRLEASATGSFEVSDVRPLLVEVIGRGASDLHLAPGQQPRLRIDGTLEILTGYSGPRADVLERLLRDVTPDSAWRELDRVGDTEFAFELEGRGRFRAHLYRDRRGIGGAFRLIPPEILSLEELGLPEITKSLTGLPDGLILVAGSTSSGKTTTLAALLDEINRNRTAHIVTLEEPVEFIFPTRKSLVVQRQIGSDSETYKIALKAALRKDPDVIAVGELRDPETASLALETADTGHLVFSTVHASSAASAVSRLIDQFAPAEQPRIRRMLASSLRAVLHQTLLRRKGGGRVAAYEILLITRSIAELIRNQRSSEIPNAMEQGRKQGMVLRDDALHRLVVMGLVEPREAYRHAQDRPTFQARLRSLEEESGASGDDTA
ncbi:MAG: PilT/PilU family type 4a pilus ATPase [Acidobacteriota bacterium]